MIKVYMADDHRGLRESATALINGTPKLQLIGCGKNGNDVQEAYQSGLRPDVLLLDIAMPQKGGYETLVWLRQHYPETKVLVYTQYEVDMLIIRFFQLGVKGVLKKVVDYEEMRSAIFTIADGHYYYCEHVFGALAAFFEQDLKGSSAFDRGMITDLEIEFIKLCTTDLTYKEIADKLRIRNSDCEMVRQNVFTKLDVRTRVGLVVCAMRNGVVHF